MKYLVYFLLLIAAQLDAALTLTSRGFSAFASTSTTIVYVPATTIVAGTLGVLLVVSPNSGSSGAGKIHTSSTFNDSVGNTWTRRMDAVYDPGAVNIGVEIAAYTAPIVTQVTNSDNITITISPTTLNKLAGVWEVSGAGGTPTYVTSAPVSDLLTSGQTSTAVTVTSTSITSGDAIIAFNGGRDNTVVSVADSDTTNGSWSSLTGVGTGTATRLATQYKVTTGTGTQTWNITLGASVNWECGWIEIAEAAGGATPTPNNFWFLAP